MKRAILVCSQGTFSTDEAGRRAAPPDMPGVVGVFLGGCIETGIGRISKRKNGCECAHAHIEGRYAGWVCFQIPKDIENKALRMHELAHIITKQGHTDAWRRQMEMLGQPVPQQYRKKTRKPKTM